ncbi:MAG: hypothetical protein V3U87_08050 [Methylococcaceae bacterium]
MSKDLTVLSQLLRKDKLITEGTFLNLDYDEILDERDSDPFDSDWMSVSDEIEKIFIDEEVIDELSIIQELSFKKTYDLTQNGELASYVSDDFELIAKALSIESHNLWISSLLDVYCSGRFPSGEINTINKHITTVLKKLAEKT